MDQSEWGGHLTTESHLRHVDSMALFPSGAGTIQHLNVVILGEALASEENNLVFPSSEFSRQALVSSPEKMYKMSIEDPAGFWSDIASEFYWKQKWGEVVCSENFDVRKGTISIEWFKGGVRNICYNCLDRNIEASHGDKVAMYWEGSKADENRGSGDSLAHLRKGGAFLMVCRTCGKKGDYWTSRCQYNDLAAPDQTFVDEPTEPEAIATAGSRGSYVSPSMRAGAERPGVEMHRRNDENSVRVTNLSEDAREPDLLELFRPFGAVSRVYVAMDQKIGVSRGFGFVGGN